MVQSPESRVVSPGFPRPETVAVNRERYTAYPASIAHAFDAATIVRFTASGTPSAMPESPAKLERMSLRTAPDCVNTFGPFDPSPGNGPAVSAGQTVAGSSA